MNFGAPYYVNGTAQPFQIGMTFYDYTITRLIAETIHSFIYLAENQNDNSNLVLKCIKMYENRISNIQHEVEISTMTHHRKIIQVNEITRFNEYIIFILPYYPNLSIREFLVEHYHDGIPEPIAANIFHQMLEAIRYLHSINICYNDVKIENFLITDIDHDNPNVVLTNSPFSQFLPDNDRSTNFCGTPEYVAPEIVTQTPYNKTVDIWSLGVSLFVMLSGRYPFPNSISHHRELYVRIRNGNLNYNILTEKGDLDAAIDLIQQMCKVDPEERITIEHALNHPFFEEQVQQQDPVNINDILFNEYDIQP